MRKRINLLKTNRRMFEEEALFKKLKSVLILLFFVLLLANISFFVVLVSQQRQINRLVTENSRLANFFLENAESEAKFAYFRNKQYQLKSILRKDANFYPYYNLLKESLDNFAVQATLQSVLIDKNKLTTFTVSFENYDNLLSFLRFAESDDFLQNFVQISLVNFSKNDLQTSKKDYRLNFKGRFINL